MRPARLRILEGFAFERDDTAVPLPVGLQRLLAYLALSGPSHRAVVAGTLWPEVPEQHSLARLRTGVWRMNRLVPGLIETQGADLAMSGEVDVDCHEQEAFALSLLRNRVEPDRVAEGLRPLWPSALLPGWYDDWIIFERERLHQLRLHALERAAQLLLGTGDVDLALQTALEAVRCEPLRETSNSTLISVYLAEGNVSDALHQYDVFTAMLDRELGLPPSARIAGLIPRTRRGGDAVVTVQGP
jgi:DNA-binding SARP family transcriptional activator